jgi:hypothetical protein
LVAIDQRTLDGDRPSSRLVAHAGERFARMEQIVLCGRQLAECDPHARAADAGPRFDGP